MKRSIRSRIRITKKGKVMRRKMGLGHFKAKKSRREQLRKKKPLALKSPNAKHIKKYI